MRLMPGRRAQGNWLADVHLGKSKACLTLRRWAVGQELHAVITSVCASKESREKRTAERKEVTRTPWLTSQFSPEVVWVQPWRSMPARAGPKHPSELCYKPAQAMCTQGARNWAKSSAGIILLKLAPPKREKKQAWMSRMIHPRSPS